jgi:glyoxylase-like metal-dependent hydrolase (beta-lactamase superfamily II)
MTPCLSTREFTLAGADKVVAAVKASNETRTTVYVTHLHPDHYSGFVAIKAAFPEVELVALPARPKSRRCIPT